jgi:hypothetical protein
LDVNIFFEEQAQIGLKIRVSEQILVGLARLGCPIRLQPNQIQGLDCKSLLPVVQWCITKVLQVREETGDLLRAYSTAQFKKDHVGVSADAGASEQVLALPSPAGANHVGTLRKHYGPRRRYAQKRVNERVVRTEEEAVSMALLEYGARAAPAAGEGGEEGEEAAGGKGSKARRPRASTAEQLAAMAELVGGDAVINASLPLGAEMAALRDRFEAGLEELEAAGGSGSLRHADRRHAQQVEGLRGRIGEGKRSVAAAQADADAAAAYLAEEQAAADARAAELADIRAAIEALDALVTPENAPKLEKLRELVALVESLERQESEFKATCRSSVVELEAQVEELEAKVAAAADEDEATKRIAEAEEREVGKLNEMREALAKKNADVARAERAIDDVPSRIELQQYQRQFIELYGQVAARLVETRRHFNTYNMLEDTRAYLEKAVSIFGSILTTYPETRKNKSNRAEFEKSLDSIVESVMASLKKANGKASDAKQTKNSLADEAQRLLELERTYLKTAKEFQEACVENERLEEALTRAMSSAIAA